MYAKILYFVVSALLIVKDYALFGITTVIAEHGGFEQRITQDVNVGVELAGHGNYDGTEEIVRNTTAYLNEALTLKKNEELVSNFSACLPKATAPNENICMCKSSPHQNTSYVHAGGLKSSLVPVCETELSYTVYQHVY